MRRHQSTRSSFHIDDDDDDDASSSDETFNLHATQSFNVSGDLFIMDEIAKGADEDDEELSVDDEDHSDFSVASETIGPTLQEAAPNTDVNTLLHVLGPEGGDEGPLSSSHPHRGERRISRRTSGQGRTGLLALSSVLARSSDFDRLAASGRSVRNPEGLPLTPRRGSRSFRHVAQLVLAGVQFSQRNVNCQKSPWLQQDTSRITHYLRQKVRQHRNKEDDGNLLGVAAPSGWMYAFAASSEVQALAMSTEEVVWDLLHLLVETPVVADRTQFVVKSSAELAHCCLSGSNALLLNVLSTLHVVLRNPKGAQSYRAVLSRPKLPLETVLNSLIHFFSLAADEVIQNHIFDLIEAVLLARDTTTTSSLLEGHKECRSVVLQSFFARPAQDELQHLLDQYRLHPDKSSWMVRWTQRVYTPMALALMSSLQEQDGLIIQDAAVVALGRTLVESLEFVRHHLNPPVAATPVPLSAQPTTFTFNRHASSVVTFSLHDGDEEAQQQDSLQQLFDSLSDLLIECSSSGPIMSLWNESTDTHSTGSQCSRIVCQLYHIAHRVLSARTETSSPMHSLVSAVGGSAVGSSGGGGPTLLTSVLMLDKPSRALKALTSTMEPSQLRSIFTEEGEEESNHNSMTIISPRPLSASLLLQILALHSVECAFFVEASLQLLERVLQGVDRGGGNNDGEDDDDAEPSWRVHHARLIDTFQLRSNAIRELVQRGLRHPSLFSISVTLLRRLTTLFGWVDKDGSSLVEVLHDTNQLPSPRDEVQVLCGTVVLRSLKHFLCDTKQWTWRQLLNDCRLHSLPLLKELLQFALQHQLEAESVATMLVANFLSVAFPSSKVKPQRHADNDSEGLLSLLLFKCTLAELFDLVRQCSASSALQPMVFDLFYEQFSREPQLVERPVAQPLMQQLAERLLLSQHKTKISTNDAGNEDKSSNIAPTVHRRVWSVLSHAACFEGFPLPVAAPVLEMAVESFTNDTNSPHTAMASQFLFSLLVVGTSARNNNYGGNVGLRTAISLLQYLQSRSSNSSGSGSSSSLNPLSKISLLLPSLETFVACLVLSALCASLPDVRDLTVSLLQQENRSQALLALDRVVQHCVAYFFSSDASTDPLVAEILETSSKEAVVHPTLLQELQMLLPVGLTATNVRPVLDLWRLLKAEEKKKRSTPTPTTPTNEQAATSLQDERSLVALLSLRHRVELAEAEHRLQLLSDSQEELAETHQWFYNEQMERLNRESLARNVSVDCIEQSIPRASRSDEEEVVKVEYLDASVETDAPAVVSVTSTLTQTSLLSESIVQLYAQLQWSHLDALQATERCQRSELHRSFAEELLRLVETETPPSSFRLLNVPSITTAPKAVPLPNRSSDSAVTARMMEQLAAYRDATEQLQEDTRCEMLDCFVSAWATHVEHDRLNARNEAQRQMTLFQQERNDARQRMSDQSALLFSDATALAQTTMNVMLLEQWSICCALLSEQSASFYAQSERLKQKQQKSLEEARRTAKQEAAAERDQLLRQAEQRTELNAHETSARYDCALEELHHRLQYSQHYSSSLDRCHRAALDRQTHALNSQHQQRLQQEAEKHRQATHALQTKHDTALKELKQAHAEHTQQQQALLSTATIQREAVQRSLDLTQDELTSHRSERQRETGNLKAEIIRLQEELHAVKAHLQETQKSVAHLKKREEEAPKQRDSVAEVRALREEVLALRATVQMLESSTNSWDGSEYSPTHRRISALLPQRSDDFATSGALSFAGKGPSARPSSAASRRLPGSRNDALRPSSAASARNVSASSPFTANDTMDGSRSPPRFVDPADAKQPFLIPPNAKLPTYIAEEDPHLRMFLLRRRRTRK